MAFTSETQLCNNALLRLGANTISSLTDGTVEANICNQVYAITRDSLLRMHFWNFAIVRDSIAADVTAPAFEYSAYYTLPSDFIRVYKLYNQSSEYKIEAQKIAINQSGELEIAYVARITDVTKFDELFSEALVLMLAVKIARRVGGTGFDTTDLKQELQLRLAEAKMVDAQSGSPDHLQFGAFAGARTGSYNWFTTVNSDGSY